MKKYIVGTRQSTLAMKQTQIIVEELQQICHKMCIPFDYVLCPISTRGDREVDVPLSQVGGKGLFVKEIELALIQGDIDFAVHSMKDMPIAMPEGLTIGAIPIREDARDCLIMNKTKSLGELPVGAKIGTSSLRRASQLQILRPDAQMIPIRGNIDSRIRKLQSGQYDAIVLASAGVHRLGWQHLISSYLPLEVCLPAVGQGALCLQCRSEDEQVLALLRRLQHDDTALAVHAERSMLSRLYGDCQLPIAAYASIDYGNSIERESKPSITLRGMVSSLDGSTILKEEASGQDPEQLGQAVARKLLTSGADRILATLEVNMHDQR